MQEVIVLLTHDLVACSGNLALAHGFKPDHGLHMRVSNVLGCVYLFLCNPPSSQTFSCFVWTMPSFLRLKTVATYRQRF